MHRIEIRRRLAGQTALSGSPIKPPALPEVHDFTFRTSSPSVSLPARQRHSVFRMSFQLRFPHHSR